MIWEDKKQGGMIRSRRRGRNREEPNMATSMVVISLDGFKKTWLEVDIFTSFGIADACVAPRQRQLSQVPACCHQQLFQQGFRGHPHRCGSSRKGDI